MRKEEVETNFEFVIRFENYEKGCLPDPEECWVLFTKQPGKISDLLVTNIFVETKTY